MKITFTCPECKNSVTFNRQEEGESVICPKCREIISVPEDEFSPKKEQRSTTCPTPVDGKVCFETYADEMKAGEVKALLIGNGIEAHVLSPACGGALPILNITQGFSIMINAADWDKAIQIEQTANQISSENCCPNVTTCSQ